MNIEDIKKIIEDISTNSEDKNKCLNLVKKAQAIVESMASLLALEKCIISKPRAIFFEHSPNFFGEAFEILMLKNQLLLEPELGEKKELLKKYEQVKKQSHPLLKKFFSTLFSTEESNFLESIIKIENNISILREQTKIIHDDFIRHEERFLHHSDYFGAHKVKKAHVSVLLGTVETLSALFDLKLSLFRQLFPPNGTVRYI